MAVLQQNKAASLTANHTGKPKWSFNLYPTCGSGYVHELSYHSTAILISTWFQTLSLINSPSSPGSGWSYYEDNDDARRAGCKGRDGRRGI